MNSFQGAEKEQFPRMESLALFSKSFFERQKNQIAMLGQHIQKNNAAITSMTNLNPDKIIEAYRRFATRVMLLYYASMNPQDRPVIYAKALFYACKTVDDFYVTDQRFFSAAYNIIFSLNKNINSWKKNEEEKNVFLELFNGFALCAQAKGFVGNTSKTFMMERFINRFEHSYTELLQQLLIDKHFHHVKNFVDHLNKLKPGKYLAPEISKLAEKPREYYLGKIYRL